MPHQAPKMWKYGFQCFQPIQIFRKELYRLLNFRKLFWLVFCLWLSVSSVCASFSQLQLKSRYRKRNTSQCVYAGIYHKQKFHFPAGFPETLEHLCQGFLPLPQNRVERMGRDAEAQEGPKGEEDTHARFKKEGQEKTKTTLRSSITFLFPTHLHAQFPGPPAHSRQNLLGLPLAHCPSSSNSMGASFQGGSTNMSSFSISLTSMGIYSTFSRHMKPKPGFSVLNSIPKNRDSRVPEVSGEFGALLQAWQGGRT